MVVVGVTAQLGAADAFCMCGLCSFDVIFFFFNVLSILIGWFLSQIVHTSYIIFFLHSLWQLTGRKI